MRLMTLIATCLIVWAAAQPAAAQDAPFSPRMIINDRAISNYEVSQRKLFLQLLRAPGDLGELALKQLVDDRLRLIAGDKLGLRATDEQIATGMEEFAGRASLTTEQFIEEIGKAGVTAETFRDFVKAGLVWREVVSTRFGPRARITEAEVDRALALSSQRGGVRVLLSEIVLPAPPGQEENALTLALQLKNELHGDAAFAEAARVHSAAPSRDKGGRLDWLPLSNLPPSIAPLVLGLAPGQVSDPLPVPNAVVLFMMRGLEETGQPASQTAAVEYAQFFFPNDTNAADEAARIRAKVDTCDDLYGVALGLPEERLTLTSQSVGDVPQNIALELAKLDEGESTDILSQNGSRAFLMLCGRTLQIEEGPSRDEVRAQLVNQRLESYANSYLEELRSDAIIREP